MHAQWQSMLEMHILRLLCKKLYIRQKCLYWEMFALKWKRHKFAWKCGELNFKWETDLNWNGQSNPDRKLQRRKGLSQSLEWPPEGANIVNSLPLICIQYMYMCALFCAYKLCISVCRYLGFRFGYIALSDHNRMSFTKDCFCGTLLALVCGYLQEMSSINH